MNKIPDGDSSVSSSLSGEVVRWKEMQDRKEAAQQRLKSLLGGLEKVKNPLFVCQLVVQAVSGVSEADLGSFTTASDLASKFRDAVSHVQGLFNKGSGATPSDMQEMVKEVEELEKFLKGQQAAYPKGDGPLSATSIKNLLGAITDIKTPFNTPTTVYPNPADQKVRPNPKTRKEPIKNTWGHPTEMLLLVKNWDLKSAEGQASSELKAIYSGFQNLNQTVSSISSTTNISIQYKSEEIKSYMGEQNSMAECLARLLNAMIRNQKSN